MAVGTWAVGIPVFGRSASILRRHNNKRIEIHDPTVVLRSGMGGGMSSRRLAVKKEVLAMGRK